MCQNGIFFERADENALFVAKCQNFLAFNTPHDSLFLVFGVSNAKYLAFGTLDGNALVHTNIRYYHQRLKYVLQFL